SPPGRVNTIRYILSQPLQHDPGARYAYSNIGYLVLGLIVEQVSGQGLVDFVHDQLLAPLGVGRSEVIAGRTFPWDRDAREPWYDYPYLTTNVFDPDGPRVRWPDGGWDHESRVGQGGLVASTRALLAFYGAHYAWNSLVPGSPGIGETRSSEESFRWASSHRGSLPGTDTLARQRGDGIDYVVLFNQRPNGDAYSSEIRMILDRLLDPMDDICPEPPCLSAGPEELLVTDLDGPDGSGALLRVDPATGAQTLVSWGGFFTSPVDVVVSPKGFYWVADARRGLIEVNPTNGYQQLVVPIGTLEFPMSLSLLPDGDLIVADAGAWLDRGPSKLVRIDPETWQSTVYCDSSDFGLTGYLFMDLDSDANPVLVDTGDPFVAGDGSISRIDLEQCQGHTLVAGDDLVHPTGVAWEPATQTIFVADQSGSIAGVDGNGSLQPICPSLDGQLIDLEIGGAGELFSVGLDRGPVLRDCGPPVSDFSLLTRPWGVGIRQLPEPHGFFQLLMGAALLSALRRMSQRSGKCTAGMRGAPTP
ncbi:MAG: serine hydrolase, partial [Halomonas sp.]|nr:serine hydrolase [Halomonas sp.]